MRPCAQHLTYASLRISTDLGPRSTTTLDSADGARRRLSAVRLRAIDSAPADRASRPRIPEYGGVGLTIFDQSRKRVQGRDILSMVRRRPSAGVEWATSSSPSRATIEGLAHRGGDRQDAGADRRAGCGSTSARREAKIRIEVTVKRGPDSRAGGRKLQVEHRRRPVVRPGRSASGRCSTRDRKSRPADRPRQHRVCPPMPASVPRLPSCPTRQKVVTGAAPQSRTAGHRRSEAFWPVPPMMRPASTLSPRQTARQGMALDRGAAAAVPGLAARSSPSRARSAPLLARIEFIADRAACCGLPLRDPDWTRRRCAVPAWPAGRLRQGKGGDALRPDQPQLILRFKTW